MFKITIYPDSPLNIKNFDKEQLTAHKAERGKQCVVGKSIECQTLKDVLHQAVQYPTVFSELLNGKRSAANLVQTRLAVIDIDSNYSIQEALEILENAGYEFALYTSYSHQTSGSDKYHIILPLSDEIRDVPTYKATYAAIEKLFNNVNDAQTSSPANLFFNSNPETSEIYLTEGMLFQVVEFKKPELPSKKPADAIKKSDLSARTNKFLVHGAEENWHLERNLAAKNMKACGYTVQECIDKLSGITGHLDETDVKQIYYAYENNNFEYTVIPEAPKGHLLREKYRKENGKVAKIPTTEIVHAWLTENKVSINLSGFFYINNKTIDPLSLREKIRHFSEAVIQQTTSLSTIDSVLLEFVEDNKQKQVEKFKKTVAFNKDVVVDFDKLVNAITPNKDGLAEVIIKHFIWQVKRKLFKYEDVTYHMMPVFVGRSGSGKSEFIRRLLSPVKDLAYMDGDFKKLVDSREAFNLANYYIYFIDEMSKADMADVESIKNKITSKDIVYRKLGTNLNGGGSNITSFIGAANVDIHQIIKDPTSSRRFFQIDTYDRMDWKTINEIDYVQLWQSVDENQQQPYILEKLPEIETMQKTMKYKLPIEYFIEDKAVSCTNYTNSQSIDIYRLFKLYQAWAWDTGHKITMTFQSFKTSLHAMLKHANSNSNAEQFEMYYIKQEDDSTRFTIVKG